MVDISFWYCIIQLIIEIFHDGQSIYVHLCIKSLMILQKKLIIFFFKFILKNKSFKASKTIGFHLALYIDTHITLHIHNCNVSHHTYQAHTLLWQIQW
jgi:hypothetical protein